MIVQVVRYNSKREILKVEKYKVKNIRFQPAGLMELVDADTGNVTYLRVLATDPLDIFVQGDDAESKQ